MNASCRHCTHPLSPFLDLGQMPLANGFLKAEEFSQEYFYPLICGVCLNCNLVQLMTQPAPEKLFHHHYPFLTQSSKAMTHHFKALANSLLPEIKSLPDPFVVEIGSNDGTLLRPFSENKIRHVGVEPSLDPAKISKERGVSTLNTFFNVKTAHDILQKEGKADLILAANAFCHIADLSGLFEGLKILLKPDGWVIFEDPYFPDVLTKNSYDQIYDEHVFLFSLLSIQKIASSHGLTLVDGEPLSTHGGSMRYTLCHVQETQPTPRLRSLMDQELKLKLSTFAPYQSFADQVHSSKDKLRDLLIKLRSQGHRICAYAATSKSTTVLNFCRIGPELIDFICDSTPSKQGKFSPGMHIPVVAPNYFENPDLKYALLLGWNHQEEILAKETVFRSRGGQWITYIPEVRFL